MSLSRHCAELEKIAVLVNTEVTMVCCMRRHGEAAELSAESRTLVAGIAQWALLIKPLQLAALELEMEAAWVA